MLWLSHLGGRSSHLECVLQSWLLFEPVQSGLIPVEASYQDEHEDILSWCWIVLLEDSKMEGLRVAEFVMAAFMGKWIPLLVDGARREL